MSYVNVNGADINLRFDTFIRHSAAKDIGQAILRLRGVLDERQIKQAVKSARSRSFKAAKTLGAKMARGVYTARSSAIKKRFLATTYNDGAEAGLHFSGFPGLNLIHFQARPNRLDAPRPKQGVSVKVKRAGSRHVPPGKKSGGSKPFVAPIKKRGSELAIFVRYGKERNMLYGPSPIQALLSHERQEKIRARMEEIFEKRLMHELDARLAGIVK